ncbi:MAG: 50S ribosomal protein L31 [Patescibacteria group bacterium]
MKKDIHPKYYQKAQVTCSCGNKFTTGSTQEKIRIELCSACHPFYTGQQKLVDTSHRVEKFKAKMVKVSKQKTTHKNKTAKLATKKIKKSKTDKK